MFAIDFKGQTNLIAQEIPSAVGMLGFYIKALDGDYDFPTYRVESMLSAGTLRPASLIRK